MNSTELTIVAEAPARGAGLNQVIGLSIAAVVITLLMLWVGYAHRTHRISWLTRFADKLGDKFHRPNWVALPVLVFTTSIICALFGFIWDVSWHIGNGRDPGPLANPAHYFIIIGLFGIFVGGMIAIVLPFDEPGPAAVRITRQLVRAGRRRADGRLRDVRDDRVPARRHLAPHLRPGRHPLGPNAFDDDRRRVLLAVRGADAGARRGGALKARTSTTASSSPSCATCLSAGCSSACRSTRSSTTSASSSSAWCSSR